MIEDLAKRLAQELPRIIAPNLSIYDGHIQPKSVKVRCLKGDEADVNTDDIEIIIPAHNFPERENYEQ